MEQRSGPYVLKCNYAAGPDARGKQPQDCAGLGQILQDGSAYHRVEERAARDASDVTLQETHVRSFRRSGCIITVGGVGRHCRSFLLRQLKLAARAAISKQQLVAVRPSPSFALGRRSPCGGGAAIGCSATISCERSAGSRSLRRGKRGDTREPVTIATARSALKFGPR
jgi:hypothetical protein